MSNRSKIGFTLIELLAVIVVLSIIALIIIPLVLNIVERTKKESSVDSSYGIVKAIETSLVAKSINNNQLNDGVYEVSDLDIDVKGTKPTSGYIQIDNQKVKKAVLCLNDNKVIYVDGISSLASNTPCDEEETGPNVEQLNILKAKVDSTYDLYQIDLTKQKACDEAKVINESTHTHSCRTCTDSNGASYSCKTCTYSKYEHSGSSTYKGIKYDCTFTTGHCSTGKTSYDITKSKNNYNQARDELNKFILDNY